jgi:ariadne-1
MVCAAPWKTCNCPWFNYEHIEDTGHGPEARGNYPSQQYHDVEVIEVVEEPAPPPVRRSSTRRHRSERDRNLDRADRALAAHLQQQLHLNPTPTESSLHRDDPAVQVYGLGNSGGHHMNDSYAIRSLPTSAARTAARQSTPRASWFSSRRPAREPSVRTSRATASAMAGLSRDGKKVGANRVGTWLSHVRVDQDAINTAPRNVEVDDWRCDGTMIGID